MTKSELIERIAQRQSQLSAKDVELAVKSIVEQMAQSLASGDRIEIRGFGSFSLHYRAPRLGRNPKTGEAVGLSGKYVPHFKPGKELRERVNASLGADGSGAAGSGAAGSGAASSGAAGSGAAGPGAASGSGVESEQQGRPTGVWREGQG